MYIEDDQMFLCKNGYVISEQGNQSRFVIAAVVVVDAQTGNESNEERLVSWAQLFQLDGSI